MRDRLIKILQAYKRSICDGLVAKLPDVEALADHLLAEGVTVQAHGYWKIKGVLIRATGAKNYTCSVCGKENFHTPFCSECGAKMSDVIERSNENAE